MRTAMVTFVFTVGAAVAEVPRVAVDIAPVHSIVAAVMQGVATPDLIVPPGASPHGYSLRPSEARALQSSDIVVWMGPALAPWMDGPIDALAGDARVITLLDHPRTEVLEIREGAGFEAHDHDHGGDDGHDDHDTHAHDNHADEHEDHGQDEHGHDDDAHDDHAKEDKAAHGHEGTLDPHAWLSPENAMAWADLVAIALTQADAENGAIYAANADNFKSEIKGLQGEIEQMLSPVRGKPFIVFHDAYHYFEHHFDIEASGALSDTDAAAPSPARVAEVRTLVNDTGAVCALTEPQFNPAILDAVGIANRGELDPIGSTLEPGPMLYETLMRNLSASLLNCLK
ncbi:zinc ABC transporter substrate-binding protein [uncultured Tateyamaria sp.]|uniref:zinc ABC transporter substrate-binding protein n=1 Tax=uncultured Tateyamaria sp. TaxID=455651 RepID=UPI00262F6249|nr:zinc ABC transporter substrate-binding protein [uncultured Tateyamaria sp.]